MSTPNSSILWSVPQSLTPSQKKQARLNLGYYTLKNFANSYDYPDCYDDKQPGANSKVITYFPYLDARKLLFRNGNQYNLKIETSGIYFQDPNVQSANVSLFTIDTNGQKKYLLPYHVIKPGSSVQFDLNWEAKDVMSLSEALLDECAPHLEFSEYLDSNYTYRIYVTGLEWWLNEYSAETNS